MGTFIKRVISRLPGPVRLALFNVARATARLTVRHYRTSAAVFGRVAPPYVVRSGPFAGMRYVSCAAGSPLLPKLIGTYELELHDALEAACACMPDLIVDIGSAEGYYAVGMAIRNPTARVTCYDIDQFATYLVGRMARKNGVANRVDNRGLCTAAGLDQLLRGARRPVVICDIEGAEKDLLQPELTPELSRAVLLLELHEHLVPGVSDLIRQRFQATHEITSIRSRPRVASDLPDGVQLPPDDAVNAMSERAVIQTWYSMRPIGD